MMVKLLLIALLGGISPSTMDHAIYISVMEINLFEKKGEIVFKVFSDDLSNALHNLSPEFLITDDPIKAKALLGRYIAQHFEIGINEQDLELKLEDVIVEGDTHWIKVFFPLQDKVESIKIKTDWFTELFLTQQNILKLRMADERRYSRLSVDEKEVHWEF